jgi:hypothetical protein
MLCEVQGEIHRFFEPCDAGSEVSGRKSPSGMGLQVLFEGSSLFAGKEGNGGFNSPGTVFGGMGNLPGIMGKQTSF